MFSFHKKEDDGFNHQYEAEIEQITTGIIQETKIILQKQFSDIMKGRSGEMTEDEAQVILNGIIKEAVAQRKLFAARVEKSVETGKLFDRYYGKLETVNVLTNRAYIQMQKMKAARKKYEFKKGIYQKLIGKMYMPNTVPDETQIEAEIENPAGEVWEELETEKQNCFNENHE